MKYKIDFGKVETSAQDEQEFAEIVGMLNAAVSEFDVSIESFDAADIHIDTDRIRSVSNEGLTLVIDTKEEV